jgi:hypothetical protein
LYSENYRAIITTRRKGFLPANPNPSKLNIAHITEVFFENRQRETAAGLKRKISK